MNEMTYLLSFKRKCFDWV